jgi:hypothetical protein
MHIHATQPNPYAALDALRSAQKTAAKREAELVRKELMESASEIAGEAELSDTCVLQVDSRQDSQRKSKRRNQQNRRNSEQDPEQQILETNQDDSEEVESHLSDWA